MSMKFCKNCGTKIKEGDEFCTNCGTKQIKGSSVEEKANENSSNSNLRESSRCTKDFQNDLKNQANGLNLKDVLIKMFTCPVSGAKQFVEYGEKNSVIALTIIAIFIQGLIGIWKTSVIVSNIQNVIIQCIQKITALMNIIDPGAGNEFGSREIIELTNEMNKVKSLLNIPYGKIFFENCLELLSVFIVLFIIIYLGTNILSKNKIETFKIYKIALIVLVPTLYFEVFSNIIFYMSFYIGIIVLLIGILISLACLVIILRDELPLNDNHSVFITSISGVIAIIVILMCVQKFSVSNISYIRESLTHILNL